MPSFTINASAAQVTELKKAFAFQQGLDVADVTNDDIKRVATNALQTMVQEYRRSQRDTANPVSQDAVAS